MPENAPSHCAWFGENAETNLQTSDGKAVTVVNFNHEANEEILNEWALQFRLNYCSDADLEAACTATGLSQADYLRNQKFPTRGSIQAGDFAELLVADYIQFLLGYKVPRTRYDRKINPNSSSQAVDVVGFKFNHEGQTRNDELITCEVKARFTATANTLQNAINDSRKDYETRLPFALNAMRQRLLDRNDVDSANEVARFENKTSRPYREVTGAAFVCSRAVWSENLVTDSVGEHENEHASYFTFVGDDFMDLARRLYELAYVAA